VAGLALEIPDWLRQRADLTPKRTALIFEDQTFSFAELDAATDAALEILSVRGIQPDQRVGIRAQNSAGYVIAVHALMRMGAIIVPINTRLTPGEVAWQLEDAGVSLILDDMALAELPSVSSRRRPGRDFAMDAWHSIIYTSGTTGRPKGAVLTYGNHWWSAVASALNLGLQADDIWLDCLPLFHVGGLSILLRSVICGMTALVHARFDAASVNRAIDEQGVTILSVVSTMLDRMLSERGDRPYPPSLRCVLLGGGPAPLPLLERAIRAGAPVVQTYGLTETASQVATLSPEDALLKVGSAGKPLVGSQLHIAEDGEIWVRGPSVSPGYLHQHPLQGWLHTGDLGRLDEDGYLYVLDRRDDLIVSGGENVYPAEVEAALLAHPAVADAGVFGVQDAEWGRYPAALVVLKTDRATSADELIAFCRERIASYKVPRRIDFRDALPRNAAGKLLRRDLGLER
jgi:O-succinylbenzoic acid--CoA ligase